MKKRRFAILASAAMFLFSPVCLLADGNTGQEGVGNGYRQDIEYLFDLIEQTNLNVDIRTALYGLDFDEIKAQYLCQADSVEDYLECYALVSKILSRFHDPHMSVEDPYGTYWLEHDDLEAKERYEMLRSTVSVRRALRNSFGGYRSRMRSYVEGRWINGRFYMSDYLMLLSGGNYWALFPGTEVLAVDGKPVGESRKGLADSGFSMMMYSAEEGELYSPYLFYDKGLLLSPSPGDTLRVEREGTSKGYIFGNATDDEEMPLVYYFKEDGLLYVRMPSMDTRYLSYYKRKLSRIRRQPVEKVIVDVRGNDGGDDAAWHGLLSLLMDRDLDVPVSLAVEKSSLTEGFLKTPNRAGCLWDEYEGKIKDTVFPFLPDTPVFLLSDTLRIERSRQSLDFGGKIIVLFDGMCFSSTLAMLSHLNKFPDCFLTMGYPNGFIGGTGLAPFEFKLPYSKIVFRMADCVEINAPCSVEDLMNNRLMLPVEMEVNDLRLRGLGIQQGSLYSKAWLARYDRLFRMARALPLE